MEIGRCAGEVRQTGRLCHQAAGRRTLGPACAFLLHCCTPQAVRNFVQLCLEGYYEDTIFHRVIKDYLVSV
jgi:hypothetical protein